MELNLDTQLLYQGTGTPAGIKKPEVPAIYPSTAYILEDMEDYDRSSEGERCCYNRTALLSPGGLWDQPGHLRRRHRRHLPGHHRRRPEDHLGRQSS